MRAIRDQRREVSHNFLVATNLFWQALDQLYQKACRGEHVDSFDHLRAANTAMQDAYVDLTITCGAQVRNTADIYHRTLYDLRPAAQAADKDNWSDLNEKQRQARRDLREAMRVELGVLDLCTCTGSSVVSILLEPDTYNERSFPGSDLFRARERYRPPLLSYLGNDLLGVVRTRPLVLAAVSGDCYSTGYSAIHGHVVRTHGSGGGWWPTSPPGWISARDAAWSTCGPLWLCDTDLGC